MSWILKSNRIPTEVEVLKETWDFVTVRLKGGEGAIRLRESRVFATKEEAEKSRKDVISSSGHHGPFDIRKVPIRD